MRTRFHPAVLLAACLLPMTMTADEPKLTYPPTRRDGAGG